MSPTSGIANGSLIEAIWTCYTFDILYIRCFANPAKWRNSDFSQRSMDHETFDLNFSKVRESLSFPLIVRVIPFFKNIFKSAAEMISFKHGSRGLNWNNLWAYVEFIQRWTICHPEKTDCSNYFGNCGELKLTKSVLMTKNVVTVMLVTSLCWWLNDCDWFQMLMTESLCWRRYVGDFLNVLNLSPTSKSCQQHIWSPTSVTNIDVTENVGDRISVT